MISVHEYILEKAWDHTIKAYINGNVILKDETDLGRTFTNKCKKIAHNEEIEIDIGNQKEFLGKRVDVWLKDGENLSVVELKLYHDSADWKETRSSSNTVETDLKFARNNQDVWIGVIDTIPTTTRPHIPFILPWRTLMIDTRIFEKFYKNRNPVSSPNREIQQHHLFVNGSKL